MSKFEQAVLDAQAKGWEPRAVRTEFILPSRNRAYMQIVQDYHVLIDPAFWQALGDARAWPGKTWKHKMWSLTVYLSNGKDVESFFAGL